MGELLYQDITGKILGAAFEVHKFLGNGFQEKIYQRALALELEQAGLSFEREIEQRIYYKARAQAIGTRRADFVVEKKVLVELKAVIEINDAHWAQSAQLFEGISNTGGLAYKFRIKKPDI